VLQDRERHREVARPRGHGQPLERLDLMDDGARQQAARLLDEGCLALEASTASATSISTIVRRP